MNDGYDPNQAQPNSEPTPTPQTAGFCQNCGRPLTTDTIRQVGSAVYCEPCLAARIGQPAPGAPPPPAGGGYRPVNQGYQPGAQGPFSSAAVNSGPNPGLAALLGLIPGVGAMYNEQYAKGVVHLIVFAVLVSLADNVGIFWLFVWGWVFYMAIEAHHTARARRDGTPLPNPFGLNDIGERMGFGKSWPSGPSVAQVASDAAAAAAAQFNQARAGYQAPPAPEPWGAPVDAAAHPAAQEAATHAAFTQQVTQAAYNQAYRDMGYYEPITTVPPVPGQAIPPYGAPYVPVSPTPIFDPNFAPRPSRFPAGAVWLIGLGVIFLLTTTGIFNGIPGEALTGCVLLGIAGWLFLHRMMEHGVGSLASDGTPGYSLRLLNALRTSVWLIALGLLFLLDSFHILPWRHSWPLFIILAGVMAFLQRAVYQANANAFIAQTAPVTSTPAPNDTTLGSK